MNRKDYIKIAEVISFCRDQSFTKEEAIAGIVRELCLVFKEDNPRFDPLKFKEACA